MAQAHRHVRIERPIEEVFDFLADGSNNPRWQPPVVSTVPDEQGAAEKAAEVGTTFHQTVRHPLGFKVSSNYRITEYHRPDRLSLTVTSGGPIRPTLSYALTAAGSGSTDVRCTVQYRPSGLARLALPAVALLHPLFAWEASWIDGARDEIEEPDRTA
jgi:uncharacterized membrane protein